MSNWLKRALMIPAGALVLGLMAPAVASADGPRLGSRIFYDRVDNRLDRIENRVDRRRDFIRRDRIERRLDRLENRIDRRTGSGARVFYRQNRLSNRALRRAERRAVRRAYRRNLRPLYRLYRHRY